MTTISDLHQSISELSEEAQYSLIRELRQLRREPADKKLKTTVKKVSNKSPKKQKQLSMDELLSKMSADQAGELLKKLQKKG
jgi:hypothetical protein